jgi:hypothetical protein
MLSVFWADAIYQWRPALTITIDIITSRAAATSRTAAASVALSGERGYAGLVLAAAAISIAAIGNAKALIDFVLRVDSKEDLLFAFSRVSGAIVVQHATAGSLNARDGTQVLIDRTQIPVAQSLIQGPGHDLQQIAVEGLRSGKAIRGYGRRTVRM